jgi:uncharacterized protein with PIN domain
MAIESSALAAILLTEPEGPSGHAASASSFVRRVSAPRLDTALPSVP